MMKSTREHWKFRYSVVFVRSNNLLFVDVITQCQSTQALRSVSCEEEKTVTCFVVVVLRLSSLSDSP